MMEERISETPQFVVHNYCAAFIDLLGQRDALRGEVRKLLAGLRRQEGFVPFLYPEDL